MLWKKLKILHNVPKLIFLIVSITFTITKIAIEAILYEWESEQMSKKHKKSLINFTPNPKKSNFLYNIGSQPGFRCTMREPWKTVGMPPISKIRVNFTIKL